MSESIRDVNIELGDDVSRILYEASKLTHENRPGFLVEAQESFSSFRAIPGSVLKNAEDLYFNLGFDGVGTKVEVAERIDDHSTVAYDLFAMVCDDAVVRGAEPVAVGSILDVRQLNDDIHTRNAIEQLADGYVSAARAAGVIVVNGEVAELGNRIGGLGEFNYNWGASVLWIAHKDRILSGHKIKPGDSLVGLQEDGFRSNGITDVRKILQSEFGPDWHTETISELGNLSLGQLVSRPSRIYSRFITELTGGFDVGREPEAEVHGVAHITGGGQPSKLGRMLEPSGLGAVIDNPIEPPEAMRYAQDLGAYSDQKAYGKWHMGPGMIIATPEPDKVLQAAEEGGWRAKSIGEVTEDPGIKIKSTGVEKPGRYLIFNSN